MKKFFLGKKREILSVSFSVLLSSLFVYVSVQAATTISTNINTGGTLTVSGTTTLNSVAYVWPAADGSNGQALVTNSTGGLSWTTISPASGGGWTDNGTTVSPTTMSDSFLIGTTSPATLSKLTIEATAVNSIPLTLRGFNGQTANLLQVHNVAGVNLFGIDSLGRISTNLSVNGFATTTASNGNFDMAGILTVLGNSVQTSIAVGGGYANGGSGSTLDTNGKIQMNGDLEVNGKATTTAATGNIATAGSMTIGAGTPILKHVSGTASLDFGVLAANSCSALTMTVTGAADGDTVSLGVPNALASASSTLTWSGFVSAADTVSVRLCQVAALATSDPAAATIRADVWKH